MKDLSKSRFISRVVLWTLAGLTVWWGVYWWLKSVGQQVGCPCEGPFSVLKTLAEYLVFSVFALPRGSHVGSALAFFLYEAPKVLILLVLVVFGMGIVRTFFTPERTRRIFSRNHPHAGYVLAALLGAVTPFCSCSAVPLFIGFVTSGVPLGVTFSFLVSAPMVNEVVLVLLFGLFGWKVAGLYLAAGLLTALVAGWTIGRLRLEGWVEEWVYGTKTVGEIAEETPDWAKRVKAGKEAVHDIVGRVWPYVVAGILVGAWIHGYVPEGFMASIMGKKAWWSVPAAVLIGVPMYSNAAAIIPVVEALLAKGAALGTVLAFMMSVIGLSLPEAIILRKVLKLRLIIAFFGIVAVGILLVGFLFNLIM
jgi:uncharacterized membrane protein YraQ (UPF0718 family)